MVATTVEGVIGATLGLLVMGVLLCLAGVYGLAQLRIWWARQIGRGSCQFLQQAAQALVHHVRER